MNIPFDEATTRTLDNLATRWGLSASTIAQTAIIYGLDIWLTELKQPSEEQIRRTINRTSESPVLNYEQDAVGIANEEIDSSPVRGDGIQKLK